VPASSPPPADAQFSGRRLAFLTLGALWFYLTSVFVYGERLAGRGMGVPHWIAVLVLGWILLYLVLGLLTRAGLDNTLKTVALTAGATTVSLLVAEVGLGMVQNGQTGPGEEVLRDFARMSDSTLWYGEVYPRVFYPTEKAYGRYKPNVHVEASTYGEFYDPAMLRSSVLADSVLELREDNYTIDGWGFRDRTPAAESRVFALGDSFVFGHTLADSVHWVDRLEELWGQPVYNLGVSETGPRRQLQLLESILERPGTDQLEHVIWMLFEGNDLENSYAEMRTQPRVSRGLRHRLEGTLLELTATVPQLIKEQSVLTKLRALFASPPVVALDSDRYEVDGVRLSVPLFRSSTLGPKLFNPYNIHRATQPQSYVVQHPNRLQLDQTFADMVDLSQREGFQVTVTVAPSAARVHGPSFEGFPELSSEPHFIHYVQALADRSGFQFVDLLGPLTPLAERELLYFRDDHHWNARGNEHVARILARELGS